MYLTVLRNVVWSERGDAQTGMHDFFHRKIRLKPYLFIGGSLINVNDSRIHMFCILQMEIAKRLNAIIAQLLPFLSQEVIH